MAEVRAGNVVFFDLVMAGIGVCAVDDLALSVVARVRILPIHACATAAQHDHYEVVAGEGEPVTERWERCHGW